MYKGLLITLATASMLMACNSSGNQAEQTDDRIVEYVDSATGIITLKDYEVADTVRIGGHLYHYTCTMQHADSMGVVINPQGLEYTENRVRVAVTRDDGTTLFDKTYYKSDFSQFVPADALPSYTMVGVNYYHDRREGNSDALYFIVSVGDPDETSDIFYPLELRVAADGSSTISKAQNLETGSMNPALNIDPKE